MLATSIRACSASRKEGYREVRDVWINSGETLEACNLHDLGFCRDTFMWRNNNQWEEDYIRERVDRAMVNEEWRNRGSRVYK